MAAQITITVKTLSNACAILPASLTDTVASLKARVWEALLRDTGASAFHLIFQGKQLPVRNAASGADATLADIFPGGPPASSPCIMHVALRLGGRVGVMPELHADNGGDPP
jgi:hypothetical protein